MAYDTTLFDESIFEDYLTPRQKRKLQRKEKKANSQRTESPKYQKKITVEARSPKQKEYLNHLRSSDQVISVGSAGTGKTYVATKYACSLYAEGKISKIILTCPRS